MIKLITLLLFLFLYNCAGSAIRHKEEKSLAPGRTEADTKKKSGEATLADISKKDSAPKKGSLDGASGIVNDSPHQAMEDKKESSHSTDDYSPTPTKNTSSGLKAGFSDDNKSFGYFVDFQNKYNKSVNHIPIDISERIILEIKEDENKPAFNALVEVFSNGKLIDKGKTYSDGSYMFYPSLLKDKNSEYTAKINYEGNKLEYQFTKNGKRKHSINLQKKSQKKFPGMDIVFIFDTTSSMGEEVARLKETIELIHLNLTQQKEFSNLRFGMVLYRDRGDEYVTKIISLTENIDSFRKELSKVAVDGGGDMPEDLQQALSDCMDKMNWNLEAIKLGIVITDAPPHLDYQGQKNYKVASLEAKSQGIKLHSVGTGGLNLEGEFILRQISQLTHGRYIFLTYGEKKESEGGSEGSVSHHTGDNFQTDKLESIVIKFAREEIQNIKGSKNTELDYYQATRVKTENKEDTLSKLFDMSFSQLIDYSSIKLDSSTTVSVLPLLPTDKKSEYLTEQILLSLKKANKIKLVDRSNLQSVLKEQGLVQTGVVSEADSIKIGKLLGSQVLLVGNIYEKKGSFEIFFKLIKTETGEVLSVTKAVVDKSLVL